MAYYTFPWYFQRFSDAAGLPLAGGSVAFYAAGSNVLKNIYLNQGGTPAENPMPLDSAGMPESDYFGGAGEYDIEIRDVNGALVRKVLRVQSSSGGFPNPTNSGYLHYDIDTDTYTWIAVPPDDHKVMTTETDLTPDYLFNKVADSTTVTWETFEAGDSTKMLAVVDPEDILDGKVKVNSSDPARGYLEQKLADTIDVQFTPKADNSQLESIVYQLTGLGAKLNVQPGTTFTFGTGPFPTSSAGGRGIAFGRKYIDGVEVDTWVAQGNDGKLHWTPNNDATRWKVTTEDLRLYTAYPSARTHYGWSCIQFVYVGGTHNCYCWVMGSGDVARTMYYVEHKPASYNADGTFASGAVSTFVYGDSSSGNGPYSPIDIMQVDETGGIFVAGDDPTVGYTTDLATMSNALVAGANIGGMGYDGEDTVFVIERDTGKIWKSILLGAPGSFSLYTTFFIDDVAATHFPTTGVPSPQWGSMFCMYGQWLSVNFHYGPGGIGFIYSDDGIYWYTSRDEAVPFYDANNDGLRWFATNATSNSTSPIYQLIVSVIPAHRRMSLEKGAVVSGPLILREIIDAEVLGTDHRGRVIAKAGGGYVLPKASATVLGGIKIGTNLSIDTDGVLSADASTYELPAATETTLGGVIVGDNIAVAVDGTISVAAPYNLPEATDTVLGGVIVGDRLSIAAGVLSADDQSYTLPTATDTVKGGVVVGARLAMVGDVLSADDQSYNLPEATTTTLGGVIVGDNIDVAVDGTISVAAPYSLPTASDTVLGGVKVGDRLSITDGVLSADAPTPYELPISTETVLGGVKIGTNIDVTIDGTISSVDPLPVKQIATDADLPASGEVGYLYHSMATGHAWSTDGPLSDIQVGTVAIGYRSICTGPDGKLYATIDGGKIIRGTVAGTTVTWVDTTSPTASWQSICLGPDSALYACDQAGYIYRGVVATDGSSTWTDAGVASLPWRGICVGPDGHLYAIPASTGTNVSLYKGTLEAGVLTLTNTGVVTTDAWQMCTGPDGYLYIARRTKKVLRVDVVSLTSREVGTSGYYTGICVGQDGYLYICENGPLYKYATTPTDIVRMDGQYTIGDGQGICVGPDGRIYLSSYNYGIIQHKPAWVAVRDPLAGNGSVASSYTLPVATATVLGGVKEGDNVTIATDGTISVAAPYSLPTASDTVLGGIKVGDGLSIAAGVLSADAPTPYDLPEATTTTLGGVIVGDNISVAVDGTISVADPYSLPTASDTVLGGVKVGDRLSIASGVLSADDQSYTLPEATATTLGGVIVGDNIAVAVDGTISVADPYSLPTASATVLGGIKVGDRLSIDGSGVLSAADQAYTLPVASTTVLGGVKQGSNVTIDGTGLISVAAPYSLPTASTTVLGGVKVGTRLSIDGSGILSAEDQSYTLPTATGSILGGVKVGTRLSITGGVLSADDQSYTLPTASATVLGGIKVGSGLSIAAGVLSTTGTGTVTGTGTAGTVAYWTGTSAIASGMLYDHSVDMLTVGYLHSSDIQSSGNIYVGGQITLGTYASAPALQTLYYDGTYLKWNATGTPRGIVLGAGATGRVAYWGGVDLQTSNSGFTFDGTTLTAPALSTGGELYVGAGVQLLSYTPTVTTNKLYNIAGALYWSGNSLGVPSDNVTGAGVSGRLAYWNGTATVTSDADLTFDGSNLVVGGNVKSAGQIRGYTNTVTSAGTLALAASSAYYQYLTGTNTHGVWMPATSTLSAGQTWEIVNNSTNFISVRDVSGTILLVEIGAGCRAQISCVLTTEDSLAAWSVRYDALRADNACVLQIKDSITLQADLDVGGTYTLPSAGGVLARTDAGQTFTGNQALLNDLTVNGLTTVAQGISLTSYVPGTTTNKLYNNSGVLTFAGHPLATLDQTQTFSGLKTFTSGVTLTYGLILSDAVPTTTTNTLYNSSGTLYWNGSAVGGPTAGQILGYSTTVAAAGNTTITAASNYYQYFTGSVNQTLILPSTGLTNGQSWCVVNNTTAGNISIVTGMPATVIVLAAGTRCRVTCINAASPLSAASWSAEYFGISVATYKKLIVNNTLSLSGTDATTMTFPSSNATIARTDAAQTFTGIQTFSTSTITPQAAQTVQTVAISTSVAVNLNNGANVVIGTTGYTSQLTGNTTITFSNPVYGSTTKVFFQQGAPAVNITLAFGAIQFRRFGTLAPSGLIAAVNMTAEYIYCVEITWYSADVAYISLHKT